MVVNFPIKRVEVPLDRRMQMLILSILSGIGGFELRTAPVICWVDKDGRLTPAQFLPEAA